MIIKVGDKYDKIVDVMNKCFGWNYKACMKGFYHLNKEKTIGAWFPKIADLKGKTPVPGDKWYGWCNTISPDGKFIFMNNFENPNLMIKDTKPNKDLHITFAKLPGDNKYTFIGTYYRKRLDPKKGWVFVRQNTVYDTNALIK